MAIKDKSNLQSWVGQEMILEDKLRPEPAHFMQATLDRKPSLNAGDTLPPLWHWLYFLEARPISELGREGHPKTGGFLPPVELPRRMWAGGRFEFINPLILGKEVTKYSTITSIVKKEGRSGKLCFVTVKHNIYQEGQSAVIEEHDIVYREDPLPDAPQSEPKPTSVLVDFSETIRPTEIMLFRYSALTFNGHRIHYDIDYARNVESYEGLVFHGPLTATLLIDLALRQTGKQPKQFSFRALAPLVGIIPFEIAGKEVDDSLDLWAIRNDGVIAMSAQVVF
ncbi:MAG: MaoC family dehydratase N-terminal domain-containing protein [Rhodobacteraceae bacterium]|nr:MaoC family dehydratase N-terminal domain-containing protein [Paracoccaceae bacterium]